MNLFHSVLVAQLVVSNVALRCSKREWPFVPQQIVGGKPLAQFVAIRRLYKLALLLRLLLCQCIMRERPVLGMPRGEEVLGKSAKGWHCTLRERLRRRECSFP